MKKLFALVVLFFMALPMFSYSFSVGTDNLEEYGIRNELFIPITFKNESVTLLNVNHISKMEYTKEAFIIYYKNQVLNFNVNEWEVKMNITNQGSYGLYIKAKSDNQSFVIE